MKITAKDLLDLLHWSRRYTDRRMTGAPHSFNDVYDRVMKDNPGLKQVDKFDQTLTDDGKYFPYAQDRQYDPKKDESFNALKTTLGQLRPNIKK